ncbi:MAG: response regulator [Bdellovibrionota bacterium]
MFAKEIRILVLDDMPSMRQIVKGLMRGLGYKNITDGENGKIGFELACEAAINQKPFGLILSDWNMPVLSGIQFLELMRKHPAYKNVPFLLVTAEGEFRQVKKAMDLKVSDYVVKPFTPALLKMKLENAYKKHFTPSGAPILAPAGAPPAKAPAAQAAPRPAPAAPPKAPATPAKAPATPPAATPPTKPAPPKKP